MNAELYCRTCGKRHLLTHREVEVLRLVAAGSTSRQIGARLGIDARTADKHIDNLRAKLGARNRTAAVVAALRDGQL